MKILKKILALLGVQVRPIKSVEAERRRTFEQRWAEDYLFLGDRKIQTVLDIGAHSGQFARVIQHACPTIAEIHSFESGSDARLDLKNALGDYSGHIIHPKDFGTDGDLDKWSSDRVLLPELLVRIDDADPLKILRSAEKTLGRTSIVIVRMSFPEDITKEPIFDGVFAFIRSQNYIFRGHAGQFISPGKREMLSSDLIFENRNQHGN